MRFVLTVISICLSLLPAAVSAQRSVKYKISFPNIAHHEAEVSATFGGIPAGKVLEVRMSRSSPGRYALHEFAKNVYNVKAFDGTGKQLSIGRPNEHQWNVGGHNGTVRLTYTLFADHADGTYSAFDISHAHIQMPATFMFARTFDDAPITITFDVADTTWKIATQLEPTSSPATFTSKSGLQYFMDSPTEMSNHARRDWTETDNGRPVQFRMAVHSLANDAQIDSFHTLVKRIVQEEHAVFGEYPKYDVGYYTFEMDYLPWVFGDGMEHRNSTTISGRQPLEGAGIARNTGTVAHEYFHSWNMERIRSRAIEPFNFEQANMSRELWFGEGFTSYYDSLIRKRAGILSLEDFVADQGNNVSAVLNSPGRNVFSAVEMSMQAPFVDAAVSIDATNRPNTFISYYNYGKFIGLGLDLTLRTRFHKSLDDYMRAMWLKHGKPEIPYTMDDLRTVLGSLAGNQAFANDYFARYITGHEAPDYETLLGKAGLLLRKRAGEPLLTSARLTFDNGEWRIASNTIVGDPLYKAGIDTGDRIITIDGKSIATASEARTFLDAHKPGDVVHVTVEQRGITQNVPVTLAELNDLEVVTYESAGLPVTAEMRALRAEWLDSRVR
jgi:predicted metalloprotease with PDZ domain